MLVLCPTNAWGAMLHILDSQETREKEVTTRGDRSQRQALGKPPTTDEHGSARRPSSARGVRPPELGPEAQTRRATHLCTRPPHAIPVDDRRDRSPRAHAA
ncbi:hypothetical protein HPB47_003401 [Ixodes persulcatus]|uniref:Uncharacterized protein n=1 Tax=Ixodes persulcatus TaxID=34615 RepID=A0AC60PIM9_IXOPE|nr:hypothetical protein HPB47_003401 [Ixodes persulcatus]